jgi:hypothetical protein
MDLNQFVKMYGVNLQDKIKLVRHQDSKFNPTKLYKDNRYEFELYQEYHGDKNFRGCKYVMSFLGMSGSKSKFVGMYKVLSEQLVEDINIPEDEGHIKMSDGAKYYYKLSKTNYLEDLIDRLVIDWGASTRSWHQWLKEDKPKEIIQILPKGYYDEFPEFEDFILTFSDLETIIKNPDANIDWHKMLSSVYGIYLIVDLEDGKQYVGSAYGKEGMLGRWKQYAQNGHGNNQMLKNLIDKCPKRHYKFTYTILRILPKTLTDKEVINYENLYKNKLGTRAFGLNLN